MDLFPSSVKEKETSLLGPIERSNLNLWTIPDDGQSPQTLILSVIPPRQNHLDSTLKFQIIYDPYEV
jgi:hypothetical protein